MKYIMLILIIGTIFALGCANEIEPENALDHSLGEGKELNKQEHDEHISVYDLPTEEISESEIEALGIAIDDEYKARATYEKIMEQFGELKPFSNIINAEMQHINSLKEIYEKYNLDVPEDEWTGTISDFISVKEACEGGVQAEIDNVAIYDELFSMNDNVDINEVFISLQKASQEKHLPAFERCVNRN